MQSKPILNLLNENLKSLPTYKPGRPIEEVARELGLSFDSIIKLASNENPLGPPEESIKAMQEAINSVHLYPDGNSFYLKTKLSEHLNIPQSKIILGNGSNEIIEFLAHAFVRPGSEVICSQFCFAIYPILSLMMGGDVVEVKANGLGHDLKAMAQAVTDKTSAIFVANPNNPTGTMASNSEVAQFIESIPPHIPLILDEAYVEYLDNPADNLRYIRNGEKSNVFVMRTFSKIYGLAGLRIGYGIGDGDVIAALERVRQPFNVNLVAQAAAMAALSDKKYIERSREINTRGILQLTEGLKNMDIHVEPSYCNFVLAKVGDASGAFKHLQNDGVITRPMAGYKLPEWLRISVGTQEQNQRFLNSIGNFLESI